MATFPGLAILTVVLGFNFLGDGLRDWLGSRMARQPMTAPLPGTPVLEVQDLRTVFLTDAGPVRAVDGVSASRIGPARRWASSARAAPARASCALSLMRLLEEPARIVGGTIRFQGRDLLAMRRCGDCGVRGDRIAMVFQDPMTASTR